MIIHNPIISGSIQFPADADGNKVTLQVNSGVLETIQIDSSNNATSVKPESNLSGSFTGSFQGDGSALTGVSSINIDALNSLGGATVAQGDNLVISDSGTEKKVTFSNLEDSIFGNISGNATIAAGGVLTIASSFLNTSLNAATGSYLTTVDISTDTNLAVSDTSEVNMILTDDTLSAELIGGVVSGSAQVDYDSIQNQPTTITGGQASAITANTAKTGITSGQASAITANTAKTGITSGQASAITTNTSKVGYTDSLVKTKLDADAVSSGSAANIKSFLAIGSSDISDVAAFSQSGTYASLRAQSTTKGDVGLGSVDNTSDAGKPVSTAQQTEIDTKADIASPTFTGTVGGVTKGMVGLGNVDNTSDANKPVSTAQQTEIDTKADLASPSLTGNPTAPTQADNDDSTKIATTAYVQREVSDLLGGAPAAFDTLLEISASIANGDSDVVALTTTVGTKLAKASNLSDLANVGTARTNLGLVIGTNVQAFNSTLGTVAGGTYAGDNSIITIGTVTTGNVQAILPSGVVSGSDQVNALASDVNNNTITFTAGAGLDGGGVITLNQSSDETVTFIVSDGVVSGSDQIASTFAQTILDDTSAGAVRTTIGVDAAGTDNSTDVTLGNTNYLSLSGQAITGGTIPIGSGGTGATSAGAARTAIGVDAAGTDNSTDVTLVTTSHDYLGISGQAITLGTIQNNDLANSSITIDGSAISLGGSVSTLQLGSTSSTALAGNTTTITGGQASAITANTAKISYNSTASTKLATIEEGADVNVVDSVAGKTGTVSLVKGDVGLGNVDNTTDALKPVSTAGQTALNLKANLASPTFTGVPISTTPSANDDSTKIATTAYVQAELTELIGTAPSTLDTLGEISASIANGDSDVVALTTTVGTKLAKASNLSDLANPGTSRTNLGVDAAGTDNSTNVTLVTDSHDYLSISGQAITLGSITNDDLAGSIANAKLSNSSITIDGSAISLGGSVSTLQLGTTSSTALAGDTTTISGAQATAITNNSAKNTNVSTNLSEGTSTTTTVDVNSSDGNNATLVSASTTRAGLLTKAKFDEIVANSLKVSDINHNVSTDLSKTTSTTNVTINSSDGNNVSIGAASTSVAGVMTKSMFDKLDGIATSANNYVLPTNLDGDAIDIDTTVLTGATVISDLDINITTDTSGRVTDANGSVGTRTLTLANLGYTGDTDATDDQSASEIRTLLGTGNSGIVPAAGSNGQFLKHDGTFGTPSYTTNTDVDVSVANLKTRLGSSFGLNAVSIGDSTDTVTIPGDLVVTGTTTTNNVTTVSTSNGVVFEGNAADDNEGTLLAGTLSEDRTYTLPNATGTIALTTDIPTSNSSLTNGENYISSFDITTQTDSKYLRSNASDSASGVITFSNSTASTSKTTGAVIVTGGVGVSGALNVGGDIVAFASSDERLKDNIQNIENPIEKVQSLKGVTWDWNDNADELQQSLPNVGVIAQDVEKVLPQLVTDRDNGFKGVDYAKLTGLLIEAVKDQQKQIDELKSKLS